MQKLCNDLILCIVKITAWKNSSDIKHYFSFWCLATGMDFGLVSFLFTLVLAADWFLLLTSLTHEDWLKCCSSTERIMLGSSSWSLFFSCFICAIAKCFVKNCAKWKFWLNAEDFDVDHRSINSWKQKFDHNKNSIKTLVQIAIKLREIRNAM